MVKNISVIAYQEKKKSDLLLCGNPHSLLNQVLSHVT
jgi:hypothetical protein